MNFSIDTTMVIEEAKATVKKRGIFKQTFIFGLIFLLCSLIPFAIVLLFFSIDGAFHLNLGMESLILKLDTESFYYILSLIIFIATILVPVFYCTKLERRRLFTIGFTKKNAVSEYFVGLGVGFLMFALSFGFVYLFGGYDSVAFNPEVSVYIIISAFISFIIQGMGEEVMCRGYYMVSMSTNGNIPLAIFMSSFVFTLLHLGNNGISAIGIINIFLFGVFASLYFIRRGNIWGIGALHTMWNFAQGNIFGCQVSGNDSGVSIFTIQQSDTLNLINGGKFGPEGGIAVTVILLTGIIVLYFMKNKDRFAEVDF